jgi:hypothetical protein
MRKEVFERQVSLLRHVFDGFHDFNVDAASGRLGFLAATGLQTAMLIGEKDAYGRPHAEPLRSGSGNRVNAKLFA